ncbi:hypothetical protein DDW11_05815 [Sulfolobus sp. SCGC AB-777_G06]|nr:hypothetical protein DDW11_05815 [Sulfolobus sp. SCGC AB-777_G06]
MLTCYAKLKTPLLSSIYRDPWTINFAKSLKDLEEKAYRLYMVTKVLIGEIFEEDERQCRYFL